MSFEDFLADKHANQFIGTKDTMIDDFNGWLEGLSPDEIIKYADQYTEQKVKELLEACKEALKEFLVLYEKKAEQKAIDVEFGVSEWESFMPKPYHLLKQAIAKTEDKQ